MKFTVTIERELKFAVEYFDNAEGGMDHENFGAQVDTLEEALVLLDAAQGAKPQYEWIITIEVTKKVSRK